MSAPDSETPDAPEDGRPAAVPFGVHHELAPDPMEPSIGHAHHAPSAPPPRTPPAVPPVVDVTSLDWDAIHRAADPRRVRGRLRETVEAMEALLDREAGAGLLFTADRADPHDRVIAVDSVPDTAPLWFIGDLHGDLLALEAALAVARPPGTDTAARSRLVLLGDLVDDGGYGLETLLRVFELVLEDPGSITIVAGNHDEALGYDGARFTATVSPSDFSDFLNQQLAHEWVARAGKAAVRLFDELPRALFFPDGLLVAHGGFPLVDLHPALREGMSWNDPRCLSDFVWTRAHPRARRKLPNRSSRGSQFGYEDFADFCQVATERGRPVTHMVRGHDHVDERWAVYPAYAAHPVLTTVALSRQLAREPFGPYERVPTMARWIPGALPEVHRLHVPPEIVRAMYPPEVIGDGADDALASGRDA